MYNRYLDAAPEPLPQGQRPPNAPKPSSSPPRPDRQTPPHGSDAAGLHQLLDGVFRSFSLSRLDTGDILLLLIMLFLFLEGDDLELAITLGLMLLLGLGEDNHPCGT